MKSDPEEGGSYGGKLSPEYTMRISWRRGFIRLILTGGIIWMLLILTVLMFHIWSCQSSLAFFAGKLRSLRMSAKFGCIDQFS